MDTNELWAGGPRFLRSDKAFALGTDSVLLSDFAGARHAVRACDLGCGSGVIGIILAWNNPKLTVDGIEIQPESAEIARKNVSLCRLDGRINIITGDMRRCRGFLTAGAYDLVVSNPPYFAQGRGRASSGSAGARDERSCTISELCDCAAYLTRWGGKFAIVHRPERVPEIICQLCSSGLEPKRMRFVQYRYDSAPNLVLIESRRGGRPSLKIEPPLILTQPDGSDSPEIVRIYHRYQKQQKENPL